MGSSRSRRRREINVSKDKVMEWWHKMIFPVRRVWIAISTRINRLKPTQKGGGILKLRDDVQTCGYEDVQVMWEMLSRSATGLTDISDHPKRKHRSFWRVRIWTKHHGAAAVPLSTPLSPVRT